MVETPAPCAVSGRFVLGEPVQLRTLRTLHPAPCPIGGGKARARRGSEKGPYRPVRFAVQKQLPPLPLLPSHEIIAFPPDV